MWTYELASQQFLKSLADLERAGAQSIIETALESGADPASVLFQVVMPAMDEIGHRQAKLDITLSQVYVIAKIVEKATDRLTALIPSAPQSGKPLVIGTAEGDYHGMGRKIVATFLRAAGFQVHDLGMSIPAPDFVEAAITYKARLICVSALLLHTAEAIQKIRPLLQARDPEGKIKLIVGGAAFNFDPELCRDVQADAMGRNALDAVEIARQLWTDE